MHLTQPDLSVVASVVDIAKDLGTEEECLAYLEGVRWPAGPACLKCGSVRVSKSVSTVKDRKTGKIVKPRYVYDCLRPQCGHQFTVTTGTIFHDTHLPLTKWLMAVALIVGAETVVSAKEIERRLHVSYRTAWYLNRRIRKAMELYQEQFATVVPAGRPGAGQRKA